MKILYIQLTQNLKYKENKIMKINVADRPIEDKVFVDLPLGTPFIEDSWELNRSDIDMILIKCAEGTKGDDGSHFNAVYLDDGSLTWVKSDKKVFPVDARIEVRL